MLSVLALIETPPGKRDEFLAVFNDVVPKVRAEAGCIEYGPWVDLPCSIAKSDPRNDAVMVIEKWENLETRRNRLNQALDFLFF